MSRRPVVAVVGRPNVAEDAAVVDALNRSLLADIAPFDAARASVLAGLSFVPPLRQVALKIGLGTR